ncbi:MAG: cytochrome c peroxidase [Saprospiraceae bacterium]|nr:cytochrome c peroxidase [Saprospiraceae bacterium]
MITLEKFITTFLLSLLFVLFLSCNRAVIDMQSQINISALPEVAPAPKDNPITKEKIELGKKLFFDPILSANNKISCATCHSPKKGFADGLDRSNGFSNGLKTKRNAPTILNAVFNGIDLAGNLDPGNSPQFYDNRALSLEQQCIGPLLNPEEMKGTELSKENYIEFLEQEVTQIKAYRTLFYRAFSDSTATIDRITKAIATYERTLITPNSPFDRYMRGDLNAMTEKQIKGMRAFITTGCNNCHSGPMFSDYKLYVLGVEDHPGLQNYDKGDGRYAFRTPTLRNLSYTAPYMHNGSESSIEKVMSFYQRKRSKHPEVSKKDLAPEFRDLKLNPFDRSKTKEIIAFLEALNDPNFDQSIPVSVPSGLSIN